MNDRYPVVSKPGHGRAQSTALARDRLTGRLVIRKTAALDQILREARCLLSLPPGIAPAVLDLVWKGNGRLVLVLEYLAGKTLDEVDAALPDEAISPLVQNILELLSHVHRAGYVHADLKPRNLIVLDEPSGTSIRLLDFGFAINRFAETNAEDRGGTLPYLAPEISRGWIADGRADLYSLGVMLFDRFPRLRLDSRWSPIVERLCAEAPAHRHAHALEARDAIARSFGAAPRGRSHSSFTTGPAQGRETEIDSLKARCEAPPGVRYLVQARPGIGLTRFLHESVLALASSGAPPALILDLPSFESEDERSRAMVFLESAAETPVTLLCGVADPSPGLRWIDDPLRSRLLPIVSRAGWQRLELSPLDTESFSDIVTASLGSKGAAEDDLAAALHRQSEGDLRRSAEGFRHCLFHTGGQEGAPIERATLPSALDSWQTSPAPAISSVPEPLVGALRVCAYVGRSFPRALAAEVLESFATPGACASLLDHGYVIPEPGGRLRIITESLWREASAAEPPQARALVLWLNERYEPDLDHADEVLQVCFLARRAGNLAKEAHWLSEALRRLEAHRRWRDVLMLLAYPDPPPDSWTAHAARSHVRNLSAMLGAEWSEARLLALAGISIRPVDETVGTEILEQVARDPDNAAALAALIHLVDTTVENRQGASYETFLEELRRRGTAAPGVPPGLLDFFAARRARAGKRLAEAEAAARRAIEGLAGSGLHYEALSLQLLAVLMFPTDPEAAAEALKRALAVATDPELIGQLSYNLALMYGLMGRPEADAETADRGIRLVRDHVTRGRLIGLRIQRAWAWADLDRVDAARDEARALLSLPSVQRTPRHLAPTRLLLAYCQLHQGAGADAIRNAAQAHAEATAAGLVSSQWGCAQLLIDALLDQAAWNRVPEYANSLVDIDPGDDPMGQTTSTRVKALLAQTNNRLAEAEELLQSRLESGRHLSNRSAAARFLHHLGLIQLERSATDEASATRAIETFESELKILPSPGLGYYHARGLLSLSLALQSAGEKKKARAALAQSIALARQIKCQGLLADGLEIRVRSRIAES